MPGTDFSLDQGQNISGMLRRFGPDRDIFGRNGKLFMQEIVDNADGSQSLGAFQWLANVTEVSASMTIDRLEVRRSGDYFVKYKPGEVTGEGSISFDKVNSYFEKIFIDHVNGIKTGNAKPLPFFHVTVSLEDPGIPNIQYDNTTGFAESGHEEVILQCVNFWSMPFGYSTTDLVTRDLDFTFNGVEFGGNGDHWIDEFAITDFPARLC